MDGGRVKHGLTEAMEEVGKEALCTGGREAGPIFWSKLVCFIKLGSFKGPSVRVWHA